MDYYELKDTLNQAKEDARNGRSNLKYACDDDYERAYERELALIEKEKNGE